MEKIIDLRSDTVTLPTAEMRQAMFEAEVGDDVYEDDPTINLLQKKAAEMLHKEDACFVTSGTMGNLLSILTHTHRADEIIIGRNYHPITHEVGGIAAIAQVIARTIDNPDERIYPDDIKNAMRPDDIHEPCTTLLCLENALSNGTVVPLDIMQKDYEMAKSLGLKVHLDGARLFNAATALKCDVSELAACADSVTFCLSKGLCAPVGSIVCGDKEFIRKLRRNRKRIGGGMRQAGILGAAGIIALDVMSKRLEEDHENAKFLAKKLNEFDCIEVDEDTVQINMVFFKVNKPDFDSIRLQAQMLKRGIKINAADHGVMRFVTHNDITKEDIEKVIAVLQELL